MRQYFLNSQNIKRILLTGLKYGLAVGLITIVVRYLLMTNADHIQGNIFVMLSSFIILAIGQYLAFKYFNQNHKDRQVKFLPTLIVGLIFSICIGVMSGLTHFVDASYIRPSLTAETVQQSTALWQDNDYSPEAKDSQVELTETFQQPILWAMQITLFFGLISFIVSFMVTTFMKISEEMAMVKS